MGEGKFFPPRPTDSGLAKEFQEPTLVFASLAHCPSNQGLTLRNVNHLVINALSFTAIYSPRPITNLLLLLRLLPRRNNTIHLAQTLSLTQLLPPKTNTRLVACSITHSHPKEILRIFIPDLTHRIYSTTTYRILEALHQYRPTRSCFPEDAPMLRTNVIDKIRSSNE